MVGPLPFGLRPGFPLGRCAAVPAAPASVEVPRVLESSFVLFIIGPPALVVMVNADGSAFGSGSQTSVRRPPKMSAGCGMTVPYFRSIEREYDRTGMLSNCHS